MRTHLLYKNRAACGIDTIRTTRRLASVDCGTCRKTLAMADAEARQRNQRSTRRATKGRKRE